MSEILEVLSDFANALEAAGVKLKHDVAALAIGKEPSSKGYDPEKIAWLSTTGSNGPYEKASADKTSQPPDFIALLEDLKVHNGKLQRQGMFYWLFDKGPSAIGRKPAKKA
jgi:hypothetical protein